MSSDSEILNKTMKYGKLQTKFEEYRNALNGIPSDNLYCVSFEDHDDANKFWIKCFGSKILVNFSSFGDTDSKFLGKISYQIYDGKEGPSVADLYFDTLGNTYLDPSGPCNPWALTSSEGLEPLLIHVLKGYLDFMQKKMTGGQVGNKD